jgi:hypothetical protein
MGWSSSLKGGIDDTSRERPRDVLERDITDASRERASPDVKGRER